MASSLLVVAQVLVLLDVDDTDQVRLGVPTPGRAAGVHRKGAWARAPKEASVSGAGQGPNVSFNVNVNDNGDGGDHDGDNDARPVYHQIVLPVGVQPGQYTHAQTIFTTGFQYFTPAPRAPVAVPFLGQGQLVQFGSPFPARPPLAIVAQNQPSSPRKPRPSKASPPQSAPGPTPMPPGAAATSKPTAPSKHTTASTNPTSTSTPRTPKPTPTLTPPPPLPPTKTTTTYVITATGKRSARCAHGRRRTQCVDCFNLGHGGGSICIHRRRREGKEEDKGTEDVGATPPPPPPPPYEVVRRWTPATGEPVDLKLPTALDVKKVDATTTATAAATRALPTGKTEYPSSPRPAKNPFSVDALLGVSSPPCAVKHESRDRIVAAAANQVYSDGDDDDNFEGSPTPDLEEEDGQGLNWDVDDYPDYPAVYYRFHNHHHYQQQQQQLAVAAPSHDHNHHSSPPHHHHDHSSYHHQHHYSNIYNQRHHPYAPSESYSAYSPPNHHHHDPSTRAPNTAKTTSTKSDTATPPPSSTDPRWITTTTTNPLFHHDHSTTYRQVPLPTPTTTPSFSPLGTITPPLPPTPLPTPQTTLNTAPVVAALQADHHAKPATLPATRRPRPVQRWTHYSARKDSKGDGFSFCIHRRQQRYCRTCCAPTGELPSSAAASPAAAAVAAAGTFDSGSESEKPGGGGESAVATPAASPFLAAVVTDVGGERKKRIAANPFSVEALLTEGSPRATTSSSFDGSPTPEPPFFIASAMTACRDDADSRLRQTLAAPSHDHNVHNSPHHYHDPSSPYHPHQHNHHDHNHNKRHYPYTPTASYSPYSPPVHQPAPAVRHSPDPAIRTSGCCTEHHQCHQVEYRHATAVNHYCKPLSHHHYNTIHRQDPYPTPTIPSLSPLGTMTNPPLPPTLLPSATLNTVPVLAALQADRAQPATSTTTTRRSRPVQRWTHYSARKDAKGQGFSFCIHRRQQRYCRTCCAPTGELPSTAGAAVLSQVGQAGGVAAAAATLTWVVMRPGAGGGGRRRRSESEGVRSGGESAVATPATSPFLAAADIGDERKKRAAANPFSVDALLTDRLPSGATSFDGSPTPEMERAALSPH
ncbi:hypothetical protein DFJ73DRAFT_782671 [Zopfochytrium polystomum]|nr:hypothetical protein DFJ73DRAFT_782671 [Zopfochytrium polystomum]